MAIALPTMKVFEALVPRCRDPVTDMRTPAGRRNSPTSGGPDALLGIDGPFGVLSLISKKERSAVASLRFLTLLPTSTGGIAAAKAQI
jgi:hypothetical protein